MKERVNSDEAPAAIGTYSQAIRVGETLYVSGQVPLDSVSMTIVSENIDDQINQVLDNLSAILVAAGTSLDSVVKFTVFLTDLQHFGRVNELMAERLSEPYPTRAAIEVAGLPKEAKIEIDAIAHLN